MKKETEDTLNDALLWFTIGAGLTIAVLDWIGRTLTIIWSL